MHRAGRLHGTVPALGLQARSLSLVATRFPSCRRHVQVENLHPHIKEPHSTLPWSDPIPSCFFVATRFPSCLFVATRSHRVEGMCKLKTCTHKSKNLTPLFLGVTRFHRVSLWRQDFIVLIQHARKRAATKGPPSSQHPLTAWQGCRTMVRVQSAADDSIAGQPTDQSPHLEDADRGEHL